MASLISAMHTDTHKYKGAVETCMPPQMPPFEEKICSAWPVPPFFLTSYGYISCQDFVSQHVNQMAGHESRRQLAVNCKKY